MIKSFKKIFNKKGGGSLSSNKVIETVKNNKWVQYIIGIVIVIIIIMIILFIWRKVANRNKKENLNCSLPKGCLLFSGVKNGSDVVKIKSETMPPSINGNDYSMCVWLYTRSSNFTPGERPWKTVMYRGGNPGGNPSPSGFQGDDNQYSVQPGVWLAGNTNKLLIRWETLGRVSNISSCCDPQKCQNSDNLGKRCLMEDNTLKFCGRTKDGKILWQNEPKAAYSMNPYINAPNKQCSGYKIDEGNVMWNTTNSNTNNETCIDNIPLDRWYHLAIVVQNQSGEVYIDGKLVKNLAFNSAPVLYDSADLFLCKDNTGTTSSNSKNGFLGAMSQVRYFKQALSPYDVLKIYSWGPHPFELSSPEQLTKELKSIAGSVQVSASVSANSNSDDDDDDY